MHGLLFIQHLAVILLRTLGDLSPARNHGVQFAGIRRAGGRILNPGGDEAFSPGDELLVLGTPVQIRDFRGWLSEPAAQDGT